MRCIPNTRGIFLSLQKISSFLRRWCPYCIILCLALLAKNLQNLPPSSAHGLVKSLQLLKIRNSYCILPSYFTTCFRPQLGSWCWDRSARRFTLYAPCTSDRRLPSWCIYRWHGALFASCPAFFFVKKLISPRSLFFLYISRKSNYIVILNTRQSLAWKKTLSWSQQPTFQDPVALQTKETLCLNGGGDLLPLSRHPTIAVVSFSWYLLLLVWEDEQVVTEYNTRATPKMG